MPPQEETNSFTVTYLPQILIVLIFMVLTFIGSTLYYRPPTKSSKPADQHTSDVRMIPRTSSLFADVNASFSGQVTKIEDTLIYVKDSSGRTDKFYLAPSATMGNTIKTDVLNKDTAEDLIPQGKDVFFVLIWNKDANDFQISQIIPTPILDLKTLDDQAHGR